MTEKSVFCHLPRLCSAVWRWVGHCSAGWLACHFLWTFRTAWKIFIIRPKCRQGGSAVWQGVRGEGALSPSSIWRLGHLRTSVPMLQSSWWQHIVSDWKCHGIVSGVGMWGQTATVWWSLLSPPHIRREEKNTRLLWISAANDAHLLSHNSGHLPSRAGDQTSQRLKFYIHGARRRLLIMS